MKVIGLTGGIGSGKSTVAELLRGRGFPVLDADYSARQVVAPGSPGLQAVLSHFGPRFASADGQLNRAALRQHMQGEPAAQHALNAILHPLIHQHLAGQLTQLAEAGHQLAFVEAALLLEAGSAARYDAILLVTAPYPIRLARVVARDGVSPAQARALMRRQWPDSRKKPLAHAVLVNGGDLRGLADRLDEALQRLGLPLAPPSM